MSNIFRKSYTLPIPTSADLVTVKGVPSAWFKRKGKTITAPLTEKRDRVRIFSPFYYGTVDGKPVRLFTDAVASQQRLAELVRKSERKESGVADPLEEHLRRPICEHLDDWKQSLSRSAGQSHVRKSVQHVTRIIAECGLKTLMDIPASCVELFLSGLQERHAFDLDPAKDAYTRSELAEKLGVKPSAIGSLVKRHRLAATGTGKARRYPKATAVALVELRMDGSSIRTCNAYLVSAKAFCNWLVKNGRLMKNPLEHLEGRNTRLDRRHDRRILDEGELRRVIKAASESKATFRGLTGHDRELLYATACASGFRAGELASLCPSNFDLADAPKVTLSAVYTKNGRTAEQPLPPDLAAALAVYFQGRPTDALIWGGRWYDRAADMLRIDLDAAGIPYVIQGTDGPLYSDFHSLRHCFIGLLDKAGATLKEAMQLARHSDPKLTMAVYGRARLHDLAGAVDRLPSLSSSDPEPDALKATGTDRACSRLPFPCRANEEDRGNVTRYEDGRASGEEIVNSTQVFGVMPSEDDRGTVTTTDENGPSRIRTCNQGIMSPLLCR
jgi:integrase